MLLFGLFLMVTFTSFKDNTLCVHLGVLVILVLVLKIKEEFLTVLKH